METAMQGDNSYWPSSFLKVIQQISTDDTTESSRLAYMAYHIYLSRNSLTFEVEIVPVNHVPEKAYSLAEYKHFNYVDITGRLAIVLSSWDPLTTSIAIQRNLFIS